MRDWVRNASLGWRPVSTCVSLLLFTFEWTVNCPFVHFWVNSSFVLLTLFTFELTVKLLLFSFELTVNCLASLLAQMLTHTSSPVTQFSVNSINLFFAFSFVHQLKCWQWTPILSTHSSIVVKDSVDCKVKKGIIWDFPPNERPPWECLPDLSVF